METPQVTVTMPIAEYEKLRAITYPNMYQSEMIFEALKIMMKNYRGNPSNVLHIWTEFKEMFPKAVVETMNRKVIFV